VELERAIQEELVVEQRQALVALVVLVAAEELATLRDLEYKVVALQVLQQAMVVFLTVFKVVAVIQFNPKILSNPKHGHQLVLIINHQSLNQRETTLHSTI
jgi:uncharacterized membrane protein YbjE (DUF340 family)